MTEHESHTQDEPQQGQHAAPEFQEPTTQTEDHGGPEKVETHDKYHNEGYDSDVIGADRLEPDYEAEETEQVHEMVKQIPDDELPDAATDEDEIAPPSPPVSSQSTAPPTQNPENPA